MLEAELVSREAGGVCLHLLRPFPARSFIEHVARRRMIVDLHFLAELPTEQRRGGHAEHLPREVPQRHFDPADSTRQVVRGTVTARARKVFRADSHPAIQGVDLERVFTHEPRLQREDLLLYPYAGRAVRLADSKLAVIGDDLHESVSAAAQKHHHLDVADPYALALGRAKQRRRGSRCQESPSRYLLAH